MQHREQDPYGSDIHEGATSRGFAINPKSKGPVRRPRDSVGYPRFISSLRLPHPQFHWTKPVASVARERLDDYLATTRSTSRAGIAVFSLQRQHEIPSAVVEQQRPARLGARSCSRPISSRTSIRTRGASSKGHQSFELASESESTRAELYEGRFLVCYRGTRGVVRSSQ